MPLGKPEFPRMLEKNLNTLFFKSMSEITPAPYDFLVTEVPSTKDSETYGWLGNIPQMREWKDERIPAGFAEFDWAIKNKLYEASISVQRTLLEDDQYGQIKMKINQLAEAVAKHKSKMVMDFLMGGFTTNKCYDGQYLFSASHSSGKSGTQSNTAGTTTLSAAALQTAITAMQGLKDDQGEIIGINPDVLVVSPSKQWLAMEILQSQYNIDTSSANTPMKTNVLNGKLRLVVNPYLAAKPNYWYIADSSRAVKSVIMQNRTPVEFSALEQGSESGFMRDEYIYGVRARYNVGAGIWQAIYGSAATS